MVIHRLIVVLSGSIQIYNLDSMAHLITLETPPNPRGIAALSPNDKASYVVVPSSATAGEETHCSWLAARCNPFVTCRRSCGVQCANLEHCYGNQSAQESCCCCCHQSVWLPACHGIRDRTWSLWLCRVLAGLFYGLLLLMLQGTVIRMFHLPSGATAQAFRRGTQPVSITCLSFYAPSSVAEAPLPAPTFLCVASASVTVHVFKLSVPGTDSPSLMPEESDATSAASDPDWLELPMQLEAPSGCCVFEMYCQILVASSLICYVCGFSQRK
jgi:hypothetical protein